MIGRRQKDKAIRLAHALMERGTFDKKTFLEQFTALSQTQAAAAMGVRPEDVQKFLKPDFIINSRPKFLLKSVREWQTKMVKLSRKIIS